jgi:hypothetical protein
LIVRHGIRWVAVDHVTFPGSIHHRFEVRALQAGTLECIRCLHQQVGLPKDGGSTLTATIWDVEFASEIESIHTGKSRSVQIEESGGTRKTRARLATSDPVILGFGDLQSSQACGDVSRSIPNRPVSINQISIRVGKYRALRAKVKEHGTSSKEWLEVPPS